MSIIVNGFELCETEVCNSQQVKQSSFKVNINPEWTIYPANKQMFSFFQKLTHIFKTLPL